MTPQPITPAWIARADQDLAREDEILGGLVAGIREQIQEYGGPQAFANTALLLADYATPGQKDSLLLAALMRLARQP